ncbi:alpha/beta fold hydrolase [Sporichthya brevicatena]|uniref:Alpha/beta fold hydrolase n=1 Tax=Sporichthya brevicatena TaxID=171442 RepID=A0ABN1GV73_9ACTN
MTTPSALHVDRGGSGAPTLLLLHGMGGSGALWNPLAEHLAKVWPGSWVAPDLPGHGRSGPDPEGEYTYDSLAAAAAGVLSPGSRVAVLGHSLGGAIGLALAAGDYGVTVSGVVGVGIKVRWTEQELAGVQALAARGAQVCATREEAAERAVKAAGVAGLFPLDAPEVDSLVHPVRDAWRLGFDLRVLTVGAPDMTGWLATTAERGVPVTLAAGEGDPMSPREHLAELVAEPVILPGLGHSAHVADPAALLPLVERLTGS